jgi:hypothetical protein
VYALIVLGHARHVNGHLADHAPRAVRPGVHDLIPQTDGMLCADIICGLLGQLHCIWQCGLCILKRTWLIGLVFDFVLILIYFVFPFAVKRLCGTHCLDLSLCMTSAVMCCVLG